MKLEALLVPIGMILNILPYTFLCYIPFTSKLKISMKKLLIYLSIFFIFQFAINYCFYTIPIYLTEYIFFISFALCFFIYFLTVKMSFPKLLFVFLVIANYAAIVVGISNFLQARFFIQYQSTGLYSLPYIGINLAVLIVTVPFVLYILLRKIKPLLNLGNIKAWNTLWIIPLMFILTLIIFTGANDDNLMMSWEYITVTLTMAIGAFLVYYLIMQMLFDTNENATLKENARMTEIQLVLQADEYKRLSEAINLARTARHDLRHHLSMIEAYLQYGDKANLEEYINEYKCSLPDDTDLTLCENYAANVIVLHYTALAKTDNITISNKLYLPQKIGILNSDLCIILGNCLENALEACRRMNNGNKFIKIKSELKGNSLVIIIDNSFDGNVNKKDSAFLSSKRDNEEGVGLPSIRAVVAKYNGATSFTHLDKVFQTSIMLHTQI